MEVGLVVLESGQDRVRPDGPRLVGLEDREEQREHVVE